jgi:DNA-binding NtrC family response regulator
VVYFALSRGKRAAGEPGYGPPVATLTPLVAAVLIIDDADSIRLLCRINLEIDGHTVHDAASIEAGRRVLEHEAIDVVLLDVHVGPADGRDLLRELRRSHPEIRVAMLTGSANSETVRAAGAEAMLAKPFELEVLRSTVNELAAARRAAELSSK